MSLGLAGIPGAQLSMPEHGGLEGLLQGHGGKRGLHEAKPRVNDKMIANAYAGCLLLL